MRLLLATNNPGKIKKIRHGLEGIPWQIVTSHDLGLGEILVEETGTTFEENARLKARGFWNTAREGGYSDIAVLADDGGIEIDALNGEPGIRAHRWAGEDATDADLIAYALKRLEGVPRAERTARFRVVQVLLFPDGQEAVAAGSTEGWISESSRVNTTPGLPYSALLFVEKFGKVVDDLTPEEERETHRFTSLNQIRDIILQHP